MQEGGRCRYTQLNGVSCKHRIADAQRRKHQAGGFCLLKVRGCVMAQGNMSILWSRRVAFEKPTPINHCWCCTAWPSLVSN